MNHMAGRSSAKKKVVYFDSKSEDTEMESKAAKGRKKGIVDSKHNTNEFKPGSKVDDEDNSFAVEPKSDMEAESEEDFAPTKNT